MDGSSKKRNTFSSTNYLNVFWFFSKRYQSKANENGYGLVCKTLICRGGNVFFIFFGRKMWPCIISDELKKHIKGWIILGWKFVKKCTIMLAVMSIKINWVGKRF